MGENDRYSINSNQASESGIGWDRSDNLNRLLSELFEIASFNDDDRNIPALREDRTPGQIGRRSKSDRTPQSRFSGVYVISVAARLAEMHPQTLRKYDKEGLVSPKRSEGSRRLYSDSDVERLRVIRRLVDELGLNLNGVSLVLDLVRSLTDIVSLLENGPEVSGTRTARVAADELRNILSYVGAY